MAANRNPNKLGKAKKKFVKMFVQWTNKLIQIVDYVTEPNAKFPSTHISNRVIFIIPMATVKQCEMEKK